MKSFRIIAIIAMIVVVFASATLYAGVVLDVSARTPHWATTTAFLEIARDRSIKAHAADIVVPADLDNHANMVEGVEHYQAHCALCHGGPGIEPDIIARGMYPAPPDLRHTVGHRSAAELFWIVKNGIKMSGMPSWGDHGDAELWPVVALVQHLPSLTGEEYRALVIEASPPPMPAQTNADAATPAPEAPAPHHHDDHDHHHHHPH